MRSIAFLNSQTGIIAGGIIAGDLPQSPQSFLLHSEDSGIHWSVDTCTIPNFVINSVTASAGAFYAIGSTKNDGNAVYKSTDHGNTWQFLHLIHVGTVYFFDDQHGVMADLATLNLTANAGGVFNQRYSDEVGYAGFTILQFLNPQIGYTAGGVSYDNNNYGMMAKTEDAGQSWVKVPAPVGNILSFHFVDINQGYCMNFPKKLYKTEDAGMNWILINDHLPDIMINSFFSSIDQGYSISRENIYKTVDGGNTWTTEYINPASSLTQLYHPPGSSVLFTIGFDGLLLKCELNK